MKTISDSQLQSLMTADCRDPFDVLGKRADANGGWIVRAFIPSATAVSVLPANAKKTTPMPQTHPDGLFEASLKTDPGQYRLVVETADGKRDTIADPYSFLPVFSEEDRYLFNQGNLHRAYDHLGSHKRLIDGISGVLFAVWAPDARRISVVGDFNTWDGRRHPMRLLGSSGVWELFIPGLDDGCIYKFEVKKANGDLILKTDPYGYRHQPFPDHAAIVTDIDRFEWSDTDWMTQRAKNGTRVNQPLNIYEVHLGSWRRNPYEDNRRLNFQELAHELGDYVKWMGYTHVELLPVAEHPLELSWGYQVTGYYAVTQRLGTPADFQYFVNYLHQLGIGVIIDWVPAHFPRDEHGLARFDGSACYEHADWREGEHRDWGTYIFNFGRHEVRNFLVANALFWMDKYHIDGLRVDAVASMLYRDYSRKPGEWIPNQYGGRENLEAIRFLQQMNAEVHRQYPGAMTIAEESTDFPGVSKPTWLGGLGFTFKWNMGWMHDTLKFFQADPIYRKFNFNHITFGLWYAFHENWILSLSHDEVVHLKRSLLGKMPGNEWEKFANLRLLFGFMLGHPGKMLNFMGSEFGQSGEWNSEKSLDWHEAIGHYNRGLQTYLRDCNTVYRDHSALWDQDSEASGFAWVDFKDSDNSVLSFLRFGYDWHNAIVFVCNFTPVPRLGYRVGVPHGGYWKEVLNSDATEYGGSGVGNLGGVHTKQEPWQGREYCLELSLPPLGCVAMQWLR